MLSSAILIFDDSSVILVVLPSKFTLNEQRELSKFVSSAYNIAFIAGDVHVVQINYKQ